MPFLFLTNGMILRLRHPATGLTTLLQSSEAIAWVQTSKFTYTSPHSVHGYSDCCCNRNWQWLLCSTRNFPGLDETSLSVTNTAYSNGEYMRTAFSWPCPRHFWALSLFWARMRSRCRRLLNKSSRESWRTEVLKVTYPAVREFVSRGDDLSGWTDKMTIWE